MADHVLQRNDKAYARVEAVVDRLAQILELRYVPWSQAPKPHPPQLDQLSTSVQWPLPSGGIFRTLPHAFGIFAVQDDVRLVCQIAMRLPLFIEHVRERLGLQQDASVEIRGGTIIIPSEQLVRLQLWLPNGLNLSLEHATTPGDAAFVLSSEKYCSDRFQSILQLPASTQDVFHLFRRTFMQLRDWAYRVGLVSEENLLLPERLLLRHYAQAFFQQQERPSLDQTDLLHRAIANRIFPRLLDSRLFVPQYLPPYGTQSLQERAQHEASISRAIARASKSERAFDVAKWTVDALQEFVSTHNMFIKIDANCYDLRSQGKLAQHKFIKRLRQLAARIRAAYYQQPMPATFVLDFWPEFSQPPGQLEELTLLLGQYYPGPQDFLLEQARRALHEACAVVDAENVNNPGSYVRYEVLDQTALRDMLGDNVLAIAHNLPAVFDLHLDYIPITDPLADEAEENDEIARTSILTKQEKFRTSQEVLNRLQWDPKYASNRYEIGYMDRFERELMWKPLEEWTKDKQAEDFVPMHRIHQFREVGSEVVVWDRDRRFDGTG